MMNFLNLLLAMDVKEVPDSMVRAADAPYSFPYQASAFAARSDFLYDWILIISAVFFAGIVGAMCYLVIKYRRQPGVGPQPSPSHNTTLELAWSIFPSILLVWIFWEGAQGYYESQTIPDGAEEIVVTASKWNWKFTYPDGDASDELHLVEGRPVRLIMQSEDVLHSFYVAAFRQKKDIVPGRYTDCYVLPTRLGKYRLACTEYCGDEHSRMRTLCEVHRNDAERKAGTEWIVPDYTPAKNGERLFNMNCSGCHNVDGVAKTGPALNLVFGYKDARPLHGGSTVKVDENYLRTSILKPDEHVAEGFGPISQMQTFEGKLTNEQIDFLIAYIKEKNGISVPAKKVGELQAAGESFTGESASTDAAGNSETGGTTGESQTGEKGTEDAAKTESANASGG